MKKIFTFLAATLITATSFAADRKPVVTVTTSAKYEVIIDGQSYIGNSTMNLSNMRGGQHSIKVYEVNTKRFRKFKKLISASSFQMKNNDININVDFRGQVSVTEEKFGRNKWDDRDGRGSDYGHDSRGHDDKNDRNKRF